MRTVCQCQVHCCVDDPNEKRQTGSGLALIAVYWVVGAQARMPVTNASSTPPAITLPS